MAEQGNVFSRLGKLFRSQIVLRQTDTGKIKVKDLNFAQTSLTSNFIDRYNRLHNSQGSSWATKYAARHNARNAYEIQRQELVPLKNIIVDDDGIGGGVRDILRCVGFVNNSAAIKKQNYQNLKTQCYYTLADYINRSAIYLHTNDISARNSIIQELEQVRRKNYDKDTKLQLVGKDDVKLAIGRSPDFSDAIMMRMYYELKSTGRYYIQ